MISLLILSLLTQGGVRRSGNSGDGEDGVNGRIREYVIRAAGGSSYAFFEFAPADGAGMGAACACVNPTGAKGEVMTFTRASTAYCTKGNETTGIANGDLVECGSGLARVMPGGDGTGGNGLAVWQAATTGILRTEEFDHSYWTLFQTLTPGLPTRTADYADGPCGTPSASCGAAERLEIPATSALEESGIYATPASTAAAWSGALYIRGTSGSGTIDFCFYNATHSCQPQSYVSTSWTRITRENWTAPVTSTVFSFGNRSVANGGTARAANDILVWGASFDLGAVVHPYIKASAGAATRVIEKVSIDLGASAPAANLFSAAATYQSTVPAAAYPAIGGYLSASKISITDVSLAGWTLYGPSTLMKLFTGNDTPTSFLTGTSVAVAATSGVRFSGWADGVAHGIYNGTTLTDSAAQTGTFSPARYFSIGSLGQTNPSNGVIKKVCLDPSPSRCR